jgi:hypothetical protein
MMQYNESPTIQLHGMYRDVLRGSEGEVLFDRGWQKNAIVADCRRLLASFTRGSPALGVQGLAVGSGLAAWDEGGPPVPSPVQTALEDPNPFVIPVADLSIDFIDSGVVTATPTNRLQIVASLGPGVPPWPDADHVAASLREFGLMGELDGSPTLINYITHPVIHKDPASTLERTIWLVF